MGGVRAGWKSLLRRKERWTIPPQPSLSPTNHDSQEPQMLNPPCRQCSPEASPCTHCWEPNHNAQWQYQTLLPGRQKKTLPDPWLHFNPTGEMHTVASLKSSFLSVGVQSRCRMSGESIANVSPPKPLTLQPCHCCRPGRGWSFPQQSSTETPELIKKAWMKQTAHLD